jgi:sigma-B regulation protein RsbU (phosphoserine phosphatase)
LQAAFGFPIVNENEKVGVTIFYSREHSQYDRDLIQLMTAIGSQIGQFIKRKQAEEELQRQHLALRLELDRAAEYVRSLLPSPLKGAIASEQQYIPSLHLGGDIFDHYWLDREHLIVYLLDVAGHGVSSALLSVSVLNFLRSQSLASIDFTQPEKVLSELNRIFRINEEGDKFFTIWYGVYKLSDRKLTYASAGHAPAILLSKKEQNLNIEKLFTKSLPIGMFAEAKYQQNSCSIEPGSSLYVFSDGVFEIRQTDGKVWGIDAFIDAIADCSRQRKSSLETLFERIQAVNTKSTFDDDFSLLKINFGS